MAIKLTIKKHWLLRYAGALAAVGAGLLVRQGLTSVVGEGLPTYITFYPVIMAAALLGGFGPGLVATLATALAVDYWLLPPHGFGVANLVDAVGLAFFTGMGIFMSAVAALYRRARQKAVAYDTAVFHREGPDLPRAPLAENLLLVGGLVFALGILGALGWQTYRSLASTVQADRRVSRSYIVDEELEHLFSTLQDMESSERGYLIMGEDDYLRPYNTAKQTVASQLASLEGLIADNQEQAQRLKGIEALVDAKLAELKQAIEVRRSQGLEAAHRLMATGKGQALSEEIRRLMTEAEQEEIRLLNRRSADRDVGLRRTRLELLAGGVLSLVLLTTVFLFLMQENHRRRRAEGELRRHRDELQRTVAARTAELSESNDSLLRQREWLRVTLSSIGDAVLATDIAGNITFLNPIAQALTGWEEKGALGQPVQNVFSIINEDTRARGEDIVACVIREGRAVALTNHSALITRDGREIPIEDSAAPIKDSAGTVSGVVLVFHDVTEKRRAQAAMRESMRENELLAGIVEHSSQAFGIGYPDGRLGLINRAFEQLTGYSGEELRNMDWAKTLTPPEWREGERQQLEELHATGQPVCYEKEYLRKDGSRVPIELLVHLARDAEGKPEYYYSFITDISKRRQAEESQTRLAAIVESSDDAILSKDLGGILTSWNVGAERLFGYRSKEIVGRSIRMLIPPERQDEEDQIMARLQAGERVEHFETVRLTKDGRSLAVSVTASSLKDGEGRIIGASKIVRDVTDRKQAEEAVKQLNAELRHRVAELQAANEEVQASRRAALSLAEDTLQARQETERINADLQKANESLSVSHRAALNLMDDAVRARKQAEQAGAELRRAAEQRRLALEAADLGAWEYHFQTGEVFWDARCREMWGIPQAETIDYGKAIAAIHPEDRAGVDQAVEEALAGKEGGAYHREFGVVWPDGSLHWIASHGRVYFQGEGNQRRAVRFIGANQDITRRRQREEQLQRLNRTLKAHSKSDQALLRAQDEAEYLEQVCRIVAEDCGHAMVWVGFAEEDETRTVRPAAQAGFEEGYLETLNVTWADTERGQGPTGTAIRTGQPCICQNMLTDPRFAPWRAEASKRGYSSSLALPLLAQGRAFGALTIYSRKANGFSEDEVTLLASLAGDLAYGITALRLRAAKARAEEAQRQSEERYRGLVELSPEALFVNRGNRIVLVNPAALELFGASTAEQLLGKSPFEVFHHDCHAMMRERISQVLAGGRVPVLEEKVVRLDGTVVDVEVVAAPVMDQGERAIQVLLRDITERKRAQAALQQTTEDLRRSNRDLEQFAYVASHDLQEPLRAVGGYVKLLQHRFPDKLDAKALGYIAGAFDGATRMERLIGDLLAFSRVATRGDAFLPADLEAALGQALLNLEAAVQSAQATVTHDPLPTLSVDAGQIRQLFQNLIGNALKFHGEQPPEIHIGAQKTERRWIFSVRDNGIGIDPQYFERIFHIFQRLHTRKDYPGTGIGLAICKKVVERHGGTIWVESQPGQGSTFYFSIPETAQA